jgi:hypothetical protein
MITHAQFMRVKLHSYYPPTSLSTFTAVKEILADRGGRAV